MDARDAEEGDATECSDEEGRIKDNAGISDLSKAKMGSTIHSPRQGAKEKQGWLERMGEHWQS